MASRQVRGPDGRWWTIRERWLPRFGGLPPDPELDDYGPGLLPFSPLDVIFFVFNIVFYFVRLLAGIPIALFRLAFRPPLIEAVHEGPPYSAMTWRANDRHVGPQVIEQIAQAIERGDRRIQVEGATFLGLATRP